MRCNNCPACSLTEHAESYEQDFYCDIGIADNDRVEFNDGTLGCRNPYNKIVSNLSSSAKVKHFDPFEKAGDENGYK